MAAHLPIDQRLKIAADLAVRARIFYDIWWFYKSTHTRPKIIDTMNEYSEFFRFDEHAHLISFIVHLAGLFEKRHNSVNIIALVQEAKELSEFPRDVISRAENLLQRAGQLPSKLVILRSSAFAHRSASLSYAEAFKKAAVTPDELRDLAGLGLEIMNVLLGARGQREKAYHDLPRAHAQRLFETLAAASER